MRVMCLPILVLAVLAVLPAAASPDTPADEAIAYRQALYKTIGWNFSAMAGMMKGVRSWDDVELKRRAISVAFAALQLDEAFPAGSDDLEKTDALPAIWEEPERFRAQLREFQQASNALRAATAATGDAAPVRAAFDRVRRACRDCHDRYRAE